MLKIGILTWFFANNYGARAHTYALQQVISQMGYDCEFVNFRPRGSIRINILGNINCVSPRKHPWRVLKCLTRCIRFSRAQRLYRVGKKVHGAQELERAGYDLLIIGSDAVLNIHHPLFHEIYYGVGLEKTCFCTYAPSCEYMASEEKLPGKLKEAIQKANELSARDRFTQQILETATNRKVDVVLDPTMLYDFKTVSRPLKEKRYFLLYTFSAWPQYADAVRQYAKARGLQVVSIGRYCDWADRSYEVASVYQWYGAFENAEGVFTDSFHGTLFAIKNKKPLVVVSREDKKFKIRDALEQMGCTLPFYTGGKIADYLSENVNYARIEGKVEILAKDSLNFLSRAIKDAERRTVK